MVEEVVIMFPLDMVSFEGTCASSKYPSSLCAESLHSRTEPFRQLFLSELAQLLPC